MVYTQLAPRRQQLHVAPAMQQANRAVSTLQNNFINHSVENELKEQLRSGNKKCSAYAKFDLSVFDCTYLLSVLKIHFPQG